jgi:hypothetical protein
MRPGGRHRLPGPIVHAAVVLVAGGRRQPLSCFVPGGMEALMCARIVSRHQLTRRDASVDTW